MTLGPEAAHSRRPMTVLIAASALALLPFLGLRDVWDTAEARPPLVAKDILATGRLHPPYLMGEPYLNKPPLFHALVALAFRVAGSEAAWVARLPSVLAAVLAVLVTRRLAADVAGERAGLVAGLFLLGTWTLHEQARSSELETLLAAAAVTVSLALERARRRPERGLRWGLVAAGAAAAAALTKGPALALVFPALHLAAACLLGRSLRPLRGPAPLLALAGALAGAAAYFGPLAADDAVREALRERLAFGNVEHRRGVLTYLWQLPAGLLPAGLALPALVPAWRRLDPAVRALAVAAGLGLAVFSIPASKQSHYLLPLFPWIAVAAGAALDLRPGGLRRWLPAAAAALLLLSAADVAWTLRRNPEESPAMAMRLFREAAAGAPLAVADREPPTVLALDRADLVFAAGPSGGRRFLEENPGGFLVVENDRREPLPEPLAGLRVHREWRSPSGRQGWVLLGPGLSR